MENKDNGFVLVAYVVSRSTLHVPTLHVTFFAHAKFQHCKHSNYFVILQKWVPGFAAEDNTILKSPLRKSSRINFDFIAEEKQPGTCTVLVWLRISYEI